MIDRDLGFVTVDRSPAERPEHNHPLFARFWKLAAPGAMSGRERTELLAGLQGEVIEVGAGTGVEPEPHLREEAARHATAAAIPVEVVDGTAESLPAADGACDGAVLSLVLCSVTDQAAALAELQRVVRPGGELRFYEHVVAHRERPAAVQRWLDRSGVWPHLGAGCSSPVSGSTWTSSRECRGRRTVEGCAVSWS